MEYSKIVSVSGLQGLYELITSKQDGAIVRSLDDKTTKFASSRIHNFSHLESIEIYTTQDNVNLVEIFQVMEKSGGSLPDVKDNDTVRKYFEKVYPDIDFERVYSSDLKKVIKWFEVLKKNNIELKLSEPEPEPEEQPVIEEIDESVKEPKKKTPKKGKPKSEKKVETKKADSKKEKKSSSSGTTKSEKKPAKKKGK